MFNDLSEPLLDRIICLLPLRDRCGSITRVSKAFNASVARTVTSVAFYKENIDGLSEESMKLFITKYGKQIQQVNFDLFRSTSAEETTQWTWRQAVLGIVQSCPNLKELDVLICNRHRLRDKDLEQIFKSCPFLDSLRIDAQFINGNCFKFCPPLRRLEMEMCNRISLTAFKFMQAKLARSLRALYVSQLHILNDNMVFNMVRTFRQLRELSIISHPDTVYANLSGTGMRALSQLNLKTLIVEGLAAITDTFLNAISDPSNVSASTIYTLSLAFCFNVGMHGLKNLTRMPNLHNLNLDGIVKRDISLGVEKIAESGHLKRLFLAEGANVSPESLLNVVKTSPNLILLDITNNENVLNWVMAKNLVSFWLSSNRRPLTILTDDHLPWNVVSALPHNDGEKQRVVVVHLCIAMVPSEEIMPGTIMSRESPLCLPPGTLCPKIRKGNRYRLVFSSLGPAKNPHIEFFDDQGENAAPLVPAFATELEAFSHKGTSFDAVLPPLGVDFDNLMQLIPLGNSNVNNVREDHNQAHSVPLDPMSGSSDENHSPSVIDAKMLAVPRSIGSDPHSRDWSLDVMSLFLTTHAFEDGAYLGNLVVKEGLLFNKDGSVVDLCLVMEGIDKELRRRHRVEDLPLDYSSTANVKRRGRPEGHKR